jgi:hypothetical protein
VRTGGRSGSGAGVGAHAAAPIISAIIAEARNIVINPRSLLCTALAQA